MASSRLFYIVSFFFLLSTESSGASISLENLIQDVTTGSELLTAVDKSIESLEAEIRARDLLIPSELTLQASDLNDNRAAVAFARRAKSRLLDVIYDQGFSTGTLLSVNLANDLSTFDNIGERDIGSWEVRLTQSFWRDAFGRFTSYRRKGDYAELAHRKAALIYERQLVIIDLEGLYWDLSLALKEEQIRLKNLQASQTLKKWTTDRLQRTAAEKSDVLQAQALLSSRELDLISARNQIESLRNRLRQLFRSPDKGDLIPDLQSLEKERTIESLLAGQGALPEPQRIDSIVSAKLVEQAEYEAKKIREQLKPQFDAFISYSQNGISSSFDQSWSLAGDPSNSATRVGVLLKVPLNRKLTSQREKSATLAAEANKLRAEYMQRNSKVGWSELLRRITTLKQQYQEAQRLAQYQLEKVAEERRRFRLGRSTVFQLVSFEVEAADAEIRKYRFLSDLRKAESQARIFTLSEFGA